MPKEKEIIVNYLDLENNNVEIFKIVPLKIHRKWMSETDEKFAYKCLPLNIANQYGWSVICPFDFKASWYGGKSIDSVEIFDIPEEFKHVVSSHFANGTFTINLDFIIQTPKGYSTYIRGVPNKEYGIVKALDAIVETDWLPFTFTYNFKFIDSGIVEFKKGEELFSFFPIKRNTIENFSIISQNITKNKEFLKDYLNFSRSRSEALSKKTSNSGKYDFQKFYINGESPNKVYKIKDHIKKLFFKDIKDSD
jgi:hypothetical protein